MKPQIWRTICLDCTEWCLVPLLLTSTLMVPTSLYSLGGHREHFSVYFCGKQCCFFSIEFASSLGFAGSMFSRRSSCTICLPVWKRERFPDVIGPKIHLFFWPSKTRDPPQGNNFWTIMIFSTHQKPSFWAEVEKGRVAAAALQTRKELLYSPVCGKTLHDLGEDNDPVICVAVVIVVRAQTVVWLSQFELKNAA